jgi:thioesterase domain-containing protein
VNRTVFLFFFMRNFLGNGNRKWLPVGRATHTQKRSIKEREWSERMSVAFKYLKKKPPGAPSLSHNHKRILFCRLNLFFPSNLNRKTFLYWETRLERLDCLTSASSHQVNQLWRVHTHTWWYMDIKKFGWKETTINKQQQSGCCGHIQMIKAYPIM